MVHTTRIHPRLRTLVAAVSTGAAAVALALVPAAPASAAAAFTVPTSDFVGSQQVVLEGTKSAGSTLQLSRSGAGVVCAIPSAGTTWQCPSITVPNGEHTFTGIETLADSSTQALTPLVLRVLGAPDLDGAGGTVTTAGRFTGRAEPGASIQLQSAQGGATLQHPCPPALGNGFWSCVAILPEGEHEVRARQTLGSLGPENSGYSLAVSALIDRTAPAAPTIASPRSGATVTGPTIAVNGNGEPDAQVQVFINGEIACDTVVDADAEWSCELSLARPGQWSMQALQRDVAGNFSAASPRVDIIAPAPPAPPGSPGQPAPQPGTIPDGPSPGESPSATPEAPSASPDSAAPLPPLPPPGEPDSAAGSNWGTPTGFGQSLPSAQQIIERGGWMLAPLVALAYVLLIALPLRAYATVVGPRLGVAPWRLTGRNNHRDADADSTAPTLSPVLVVVATFLGAAVIAALSGGITTEVRYLRLTAAIGLGLVLVNLLGVVLPAKLAGRAVRSAALVRLLPGILAAALLAALLSRFLELQPPVLLGVLVAALALEPARLRARGGIAVAQIAGVAVVALLAWVTHALLMPSVGFWATFATETTAAIALGGFGSLLLLLLPVGPFPGRELYAISRGGWLLVALATASVTGAIVASGSSFPLVMLGLLAAGTAAVLTALSVWVRWVAPALDR